MNGGSWHCTGGSDQNHPQEKQMEEGKMAVWGGLTNICEEKPLSLKLNPQPWREEIDTICQSFDCTIRNPEKWEHFFRISYIDALSLKSGSTSPVRSCLLKFFWYWTMPLAIQNPINSILQGIKVVYLSPNTTSLIQPLDQRVIRTFNAHYI